METPVEETRTGISRRTALKRIGVGTAVVWAAPMVMSIETPAFAGSVPCTNCDNTCPKNGNMCGPGNFCFRRPAGGCICTHANDCGSGNHGACPNGDSDCPTGTFCAITCCGSGGTETAQICVSPADPPSTPGWNYAGYYNCNTDADCTSPQTCQRVYGMQVCQ